MKFAFLYFSIKASFAEMHEYFFNMLVIFRHVIQIDKYIIQIDYDTDIQEIGENVIHKSLKNCGSISKTKRHY